MTNRRCPVLISGDCLLMTLGYAGYQDECVCADLPIDADALSHLADNPDDPRPPVQVHVNVSWPGVNGRHDTTIEIDRATWDVLTPAGRSKLCDDLAALEATNKVGWGWHIHNPEDFASTERSLAREDNPSRMSDHVHPFRRLRHFIVAAPFSFAVMVLSALLLLTTFVAAWQTDTVLAAVVGCILGTVVVLGAVATALLLKRGRR